MSRKVTVLLVGIAMVVVGAAGLGASIAIHNATTPPLVCVAEGEASSGYADSTQGDCPVSMESFEAYRKHISLPAPIKALRVGLFGLAVAGIVVAAASIFVRNKPKM